MTGIARNKKLIIAIVTVTGIFLVTCYLCVNFVLAAVFAKPLSAVCALDKAEISADALTAIADNFFAKDIDTLLDIEDEQGTMEFVRNEQQFDKLRDFTEDVQQNVTARQLSEFNYYATQPSNAGIFKRVGMLYSGQLHTLIGLAKKYKSRLDTLLPYIEKIMLLLHGVTFEYGQCVSFYDNLYKVFDNLQATEYADIIKVVDTIAECANSQNIAEDVAFKDIVFSVRCVGGLVHNVTDIEQSLRFISKITANQKVKAVCSMPSLAQTAIDMACGVTDEQLNGVVQHLFDYNATFAAACQLGVIYVAKYPKVQLAAEATCLLKELLSESKVDGGEMVDFVFRAAQFDPDNLSAQEEQEISEFLQRFKIAE